MATGQATRLEFMGEIIRVEPVMGDAVLTTFTAPDVIGVGGHVTPNWRAPRPSWFPEEFLWVVGCSYAGLPETQAEVRNPIGANMAFRRSVFARSGGFDPDTFGDDGQDYAETEQL